MIFWYTDNNISKTIAVAFRDKGIKTSHINYFTPQPSIFYGILRGCGNAMNVCKYTGNDYYYIDNGYTEAEYVNKDWLKNTRDGTYRFVKNDMIDKYEGSVKPTQPTNPIKSCLLIPPSPYTAYFYNTTPEDFILEIANKYPDFKYTIRKKSADTDLESEILNHDCVIAFNSMSIMKAIELGKPVMDCKGVTRQKELLLYNYEDVINFYKDKQFKLNDLARL
jgi:hypothetical protein